MFRDICKQSPMQCTRHYRRLSDRLDVLLPGVLLPGVLLPGVLLPVVLLPGVLLPVVLLPGVLLTGVLLPGVSTQHFYHRIYYRHP